MFSIQWEEGRRNEGVTLSWSEGGGGEGEKKEGKQLSDTFDGAIICLPVGCYQDVDFSPELPNEKSHTLSCLNSGTTEKHILIFDQVFWKSSR